MWQANSLAPKEKADQWPTPRLRKARWEMTARVKTGSRRGYMTSYYLCFSLLFAIFSSFLAFLIWLHHTVIHIAEFAFTASMGSQQLVDAHLDWWEQCLDDDWFNSSTCCDLNFAWCSCCRSSPMCQPRRSSPLESHTWAVGSLHGVVAQVATSHHG